MRLLDPEQRVVTLTNSSRSTFDVCQFKLYLSAIHGGFGIKRRLPDPALRFGRAVHKALEVGYANGGDTDKMLGAATGEYRKVLENPTITLSDEITRKMDMELAMIEALIPVYVDHHIDDFIHWKVIQNETTMIAEIPGGLSVLDKKWRLMFAGKVDLIIRDEPERGEIIIIDHKTASQFKSSIHDRMQYDFQPTGYLWLARECGVIPKHSTVKIMYNYIKKSSIRGGAREGLPSITARIRDAYAAEPDKYFKRVVTVRSADDMSEFVQTTGRVAMDILVSDQIYNQWRRNMWTCDMYAGCPFRDICVSRVIDDKVMYEPKQSSHEELMEDDD